MHFRALGMSLMLAALAAPAAAEPVEPTYGQVTPEAAREKFNREQAIKARLQLADNAASKAEFEAATVAREAQIRSDQEAWEAEKARLVAEHESAMAQWRADVAACRSGDNTKCRR